MWHLFVFISLALGLLVLQSTCAKPVHRYVGIIISVSSWDGRAELKTKTETGKDTIISVYPNRAEKFVVNQIITIWTGGEMLGNDGSTRPQ